MNSSSNPLAPLLHAAACGAISISLLLVPQQVRAQAGTPLIVGTPIAPIAIASPEAPVEDATVRESETEINVKNADLEAIIRIFSKRTKRNYILDEKVKGKVSIFLPGKISSDESIKILDSVLALKGFTAVPISDNLWKVIPSREARQTTIPTLTESREGSSAAVVTRLLQLKYVSAEDVKQLLSQLVSADGLVNAYTGTNSLILIDSEDNIDRLVSLVEILDVPFTDREMTIVPIKNADAKEIAEKLLEILGDGKKSGSDEGASAPDLARARFLEAMANRANPPAGGNSAGIAPQASALGNSGQTVSARAREPKIIADERTNSIIVVADEDTTLRIRALISQLDSEVDLSGVRFYVYRCQHAKADELAQVLAGLVGEGSSSSGSTATSNRNSSGRTLGNSDSDSDSGLGLSRSNSRSGGSSGFGSSSSSRNSSSNRSGSSSSGPTAVNLGDNISVTADPATNSLIIRAGKSDYQKIVDLLRRLDTKRRQVLVEAMLLEVGVLDRQAMGVEFSTSGGGSDGGIIARNDLGNLTNILSDPTRISGFAVAAASAGTISLPGGISIPTQTVLLTAAKSNSNVNVLSAPTILTTDNEEAQITVGQNIPFITSTSTNETNLNNTFNQVERQDVGIKLRITPQISSRDFVTLSIFTEVSNVVEGTQGSNLGPTTTIRNSETKVITKDGQMIVTGGLMSDDVTSAESGVPFLKDLPLFGQVFKTSTENRRRTNLLIFITPRIVKDQFDARELTVEGRDAMRGTIQNFESYPEREEVLDSLAIDRVAEAPAIEGDTVDEIGERKPEEGKVRKDHGTIRKPATVHSEGMQLQQPISQESTALGSASIAGNTLELRAAPPLPQFQAASRTNRGEELQRAGTSPHGGTGRFVTLRRTTELPPGVDLPFDTVGTALVKIEIPADSAPRAHSFFRQGGEYQYRSPAGPISFRVDAIGDSGTSEDRNSEHPGIWYTLSPHDVMALGTSQSLWSPVP